MDKEKSGGYLPAQYKELSYDNKLKLLIANEPVLLERQKNTGEPILRMKGITQSYYMYDSITYKKANAMMKRLEEEARTGRAENPFGDVSKSNNSMGDINPGNGSSMSAPVNIANQSDAIEMVE